MHDCWLRCGQNLKEVLEEKSNGVVSRKGWIGKGDQEEVDSVGDTGILGDRHVAFVVAVVSEGRSNIKTK